MSDDPRLTEALRSKARSFDPHLAGLDEVVGRAHAIRRRRRTTAGVVAAVAVAAIAVPTAALLRPDDGQRVTPAGTPPSVSASPTTGVTPTPPSLAQIERGPDSSVTYATGAEVHQSNVGTGPLPVADGHTFAGYKGGWLVSTTDGVQDTVREYDASGHLVAAHPGSGPVIGQDGTQVAWWWQDGPHGSGHVYSGGASSMGNGAAATATPAGTPVTVVGFSPDGVVYLTTNAQGNQQVWTAQPGATPTKLPGLLNADAVLQSPALISGEASQGSGEMGCPTVFSLPAVKPLWKHCGGGTIESFSPTGEAAVTTDQAEDGTFTRVRIVDARKGTAITSYAPRAPLELDGPVVWEPDGMAVVMELYDAQRHTWALVRLTTSGTVDRVSAVVPGRQDAPPFAFAAPL
jgi:hypothetical protein